MNNKYVKPGIVVLGFIGTIITIIQFDPAKRLLIWFSETIITPSLLYVQAITPIILLVSVGLMAWFYFEIRAMHEKNMRDINEILVEIKDEGNTLLECNRKCCSLYDNAKTFLDAELTLGIGSIKIRESYSNKYYIDFYRKAEKLLVISGHSLNKVIDREVVPDLRNAFKEAIIRVISKEGYVKILLQKVQEEDQVYAKRASLMGFIKEVVNEVPAEKLSKVLAENFLVKEAKYLPYSVAQNDETTLIAMYKMKEIRGTANRDIYVLNVNKTIGYGKCYIDDFHIVFDREATAIDLSEALG